MFADTNGIQYITERAAEMMNTFLRTNGKPPRIGQWKDKYKNSAMLLLWQCHLEGMVPPVDLVMLMGCLFGQRHDWSVAKFAAISFLAQHYEPLQSGQDLPEGAKTRLAEIIKEHGGVLKKARKLDDVAGNDERDYRRTVDSWVKEPLFLYLWAQKYDRHQARKKYDRSNLLVAAKEALSKETLSDSNPND